MTNVDWQCVGKVSDIDSQTNLKRVEAFGKAICLYSIDGSVYATQDLCTHGNACLSEGWLEDGTIECPLHQGVFEIASGKAIAAPAVDDLEVYPTKVEGGKIYLKTPT